MTTQPEAIPCGYKTNETTQQWMILRSARKEIAPHQIILTGVKQITKVN